MAQLPPRLRAAIKRAFEATGCMDLYEDDALAYLKVIEQVLKSRHKMLLAVSENTNNLVGILGKDGYF